jgi:hypothetical protein
MQFVYGTLRELPHPPRGSRKASIHLRPHSPLALSLVAWLEIVPRPSAAAQSLGWLLGVRGNKKQPGPNFVSAAPKLNILLQ